MKLRVKRGPKIPMVDRTYCRAKPKDFYGVEEFMVFIRKGTPGTTMETYRKLSSYWIERLKGKK